MGWTGREIAEAITAGLWRAMRSRGYGAIRRIERSLGLADNALRMAKHRATGMRLSEVAEVLAELDLPPGAFFGGVFNGRVSAADRFLADGARLADVGVVELPELAERTVPDRLTAGDLAKLDALRFEDPKAAVELASGVVRAAARDGRKGDTAAAMARLGSALRVAEQWDAAHACLWWVLNAEADSEDLIADTWTRAAYVVSDYGSFDDAAALATLALVARAEMGDSIGIGKALVDRAMFQQNAGAFEAAIRGFRSALVFLPDNTQRYRFAAHLNLGLAYVAVGDLNAARDRAALAASSCWAQPAAGAVHLDWLRARIAAAERDYDLAVQLYLGVIDGVGQTGNAALASCELCRVHLQAGATAQAVALARSMARLTMPKGNRIIAAAVADLVRAALVAGEVSSSQLEVAIARIDRALKARAGASRPAAGS